MADDFRDSLMDAFVFETSQYLSDLENILMQAEKDDGSVTASISEIFRIMHTIKSSAAMMGFDGISQLAHATEDLFAYLRDHPEAAIDHQRLTDLLLDAIDAIKQGTQGDARDASPIIDSVRRFLSALQGTPATPPPAQAAPVAAPMPAPEPASGSSRQFRIYFKPNCQMVALRAFEIQNQLAKLADEISVYPENDSENEDEIIQEEGFLVTLHSSHSASELLSIIHKSPFVEDVHMDGDLPAPKPIAQPAPVEGEAEHAAPHANYISITTDKLDQLVDLIGELTIAEMEITQRIGDINEDGRASLTRLHKLIGEMQETILSTRMVPIRDTFTKMQRVIRDISRKQDKSVQLVIHGEATEVDRNTIESLNAPLVHLIRNAVDHGIEPEAERVALGKPPEGTISLGAYAEGRHVVISVADDGKGVDKQRLLDRALASGIITPADAERMTETEIFSLMLLPGFSTSDRVTEFSGRGVGMDVVSSVLRTLHGQVHIASTAGKGTEITLRLPLTMAIIDAFIVRIGDAICAIPIASATRILGARNHPPQMVNGAPAIVINGRCYRVLELRSLFAQGSDAAPEKGALILIKSDTHDFAVHVDDILDRQNIVVKPVPTLLKSIQGVSGCTILGDGKISLILAVEELFAAQTRREEAHDA